MRNTPVFTPRRPHRSATRLRMCRCTVAAALLLVGACGGDSGGGTPVAPPVPPTPEALTALSVSPATVALVVGETGTLTPAPVTGGGAVSVSYSYSTSASGVASVNSSGVITAVAAGTATITVSATGSGTGFTTSARQATVVVTVSPPPPALGELTVTPDSIGLLTGGSATLTPSAVTAGAGVTVQYAYASSGESIATVNANGVVTAVSPGSATITVTATGSGTGFTTTQRSTSAIVIVTAPPPALTALTVTPDSVSLVTGTVATLTPAASVGGTGVSVELSYMSSANAVATVSDSGVITAVAPGSAIITVSAIGSGSGYATTERQSTVPVIVVAPPPALTAFTVSPDSVALLAGANITLTPSTSTSGAAVSVSLEYASSADAIASVSNAGVVTAVSAGSTTITVTATGSGVGFATTALQASVPVTVTAAPTVLGIGFDDGQFAHIPAGSFLMGSANGDVDEQPVRMVTITQPFLMQKTEVTQAQWRQVMQGTGLANPSHFSACGDTCPVENISWNDIQVFLTRLNQQDPGKNYRLPTEAEWEYAARAGSTGDYSGNGVLNSMGWWSGNSGETTHPVARKLANAWGLFDVHGNVWEWVNDWYSETYYSNAPSQDPPGAASGLGRAFRSGSWVDTAEYTRSAVRANAPTTFRNIYSGFRMARTL